MNTGEKAIVPYTMLNIKKCMCPQCPVQADSKCVKEKLESLKRELEGAREVDVSGTSKSPGNILFDR